jgi:hypothetical protein
MRHEVPCAYKTTGLDRMRMCFNRVNSTVQMGSFQCLVAMQNNVLLGIPERKRQLERPKRRLGQYW